MILMQVLFGDDWTTARNNQGNRIGSNFCGLFCNGITAWYATSRRICVYSFLGDVEEMVDDLIDSWSQLL
jgi:hypothetical protein